VEKWCWAQGCDHVMQNKFGIDILDVERYLANMFNERS